MQTIQVRTTQNVHIHYPLASAGDRIIAYLIDRLAITMFCVVMGVALFYAIGMEYLWIYLIIIGFPLLFYGLFFEIFMNGQTLGKRALNIRVISTEGTEPTVGAYILRWIFGLIDFQMGGAVALICILAGGKGQRIGDLVARTTVIKSVATRDISAAEIFITPADTYQPVFPDVTALSPNEIDIIHQALRVGMTGNTKPAEVVAEKIKAMLRIQSDLSPLSFLETIVKDYNHLNARL